MKKERLSYGKLRPGHMCYRYRYVLIGKDRYDLVRCTCMIVHLKHSGHNLVELVWLAIGPNGKVSLERQTLLRAGNVPFSWVTVRSDG